MKKNKRLRSNYRQRMDEYKHIIDKIIFKRKLSNVNKTKLLLSISKALIKIGDIKISKKELYERIEKIVVMSVCFGTAKKIKLGKIIKK